MEYITRELERKFLKLNDFFKVILVTGARQVGKTTMLKHLAESNRTYVTITPEKPTESVAETVKKVFQEAKDTIVTKAASMKPFEGEKIEEFFDDEDEEGDTNE